jgi:GT2 family glycosyltransferase
VAESDIHVAVVVLNWNGWQDTLVCLESLLRSRSRSLDIIVCDNGSHNDSVQRIREWCANKGIHLHEESCLSPNKTSLRVFLFQTGGNLGFARGNNVGIRLALQQRAEYVFVLNNDAHVSPDCIAELVEYGQSHRDVALLGPKILDDGTSRYTQWAVLRRLDFLAILLVLSPLRRLIEHTRLFKRYFCLEEGPSKVYAIPGSAMMFRASALSDIGLFDETTFLYWEEFIIAEKLRQHGLPTVLLPSAVVWHKMSASIDKIGAWKFIENVKSERYFFNRYLRLPLVHRLMLYIIRLAAYFLRSIGDKSYRKNTKQFLRALFS